VAKATYVPEVFGTEVVAPAGYYLPLEAAFAEYNGRQLLYILGNYGIEASCCGVGSWNYLRVEGYILQSPHPESSTHDACYEIETIENDLETKEIGKLLLDRHPGVRIEFR
jgi:hypothetical protein